MRNLSFIVVLAIGMLIGFELVPRSSQGSITLTVPYTISGPMISSETDPYVGLMGMQCDQVQNTMGFTIYPATAQTTNAGKVTGITPSGQLPVITVNINTQSGAWNSSNGKAGVLTGASLTGAQGWLAACPSDTMKNQAEPAWITMGILPGTQTPWQ